jgi:hypothetical protein
VRPGQFSQVRPVSGVDGEALIVTPGLWIMIPAMAAAGGSGLFLSKSRKRRLVDARKQRKPFIAANGLRVRAPCAIALKRWAAAGSFDNTFYAVQAAKDRGRHQLHADGAEHTRRSAHEWPAAHRAGCVRQDRLNIRPARFAGMATRGSPGRKRDSSSRPAAQSVP